jgi:hypothetical protein
MTQLLKNLGAALVERADQEEAAAEPVAKDSGKQNGQQEMDRLVEAHVSE